MNKQFKAIVTFLPFDFLKIALLNVLKFINYKLLPIADCIKCLKIILKIKQESETSTFKNWLVVHEIQVNNAEHF